MRAMRKQSHPTLTRTMSDETTRPPCADCEGPEPYRCGTEHPETHLICTRPKHGPGFHAACTYDKHPAQRWATEPSETCWDCNGNGAVKAAIGDPECAGFPCPRCRATGRVPTIMRSWVWAGKELRAQRHNADRCAREEAKHRGVPLGMYCDAEEGRIDPATLD